MVWQSTFEPSGMFVLRNLDHLPKGVLILSIRSGGKEERVTDKNGQIIEVPNLK